IAVVVQDSKNKPSRWTFAGCDLPLSEILSQCGFDHISRPTHAITRVRLHTSRGWLTVACIVRKHRRGSPQESQHSRLFSAAQVATCQLSPFQLDPLFEVRLLARQPIRPASLAALATTRLQEVAS